MLHASQSAPGAIGVVPGSCLESSVVEGDLLGRADCRGVEDGAGREVPYRDIVFDMRGKVKGGVRARDDGRDG